MKIIYYFVIINIKLTSNITSEKDNLKLNISFKYSSNTKSYKNTKLATQLLKLIRNTKLLDCMKLYCTVCLRTTLCEG